MYWAEKLGLFGVPLQAQQSIATAHFRERIHRDTYFAELGQNFVVFNDQDLGREPITDDDIVRVQASGAYAKQCENAAWSADCEWYFVILPHSIALLNVYSLTGFLCRKKSSVFIEVFLNAPVKARKGK